MLISNVTLKSIHLIIDRLVTIQSIPANGDPVDQPHHCCNQDKNTDTHSKSNPGQCKPCQSYPSGLDLPVETAC
jgi:hypothetical protein